MLIFFLKEENSDMLHVSWAFLLNLEDNMK